MLGLFKSWKIKVNPIGLVIRYPICKSKMKKSLDIRIENLKTDPGADFILVDQQETLEITAPPADGNIISIWIGEGSRSQVIMGDILLG